MPAECIGGAAQTKLASWMEPFSAAFTAPTWQRVLVLIVGAILSPGRLTVASALRVICLDQDPRFSELPPGSQPQSLVEPAARTLPVSPVGQHLRL